MAAGAGGRSQKLALLVLVGLVAGFGGWNYRRNIEAERAQPRPFRSYSDADLETLASAYQQELDGFAKRYREATGRAVGVTGGAPLAEQIAQFERVQRHSRKTRELARGIAEREASLAELEREKRLRAEESRVLTQFLKRAFVYRG